MDINKRLYKLLNEYFKDNIELSFVSPINILLITKEDRVYQFDEYVNKTYSSIAYTSDETVVQTLIEKSIVKELCNKRIIDFKSGEYHTVARTYYEKVYVWGIGVYGNIGNGIADDGELYKPNLNEYLNDLNIIDMSCGYYHTLVLTSNGDIYAWGGNRFGQIGDSSDEDCQLIPYKMNDFMSEKFKAISCGAEHSMALTEGGRVFGCGRNDCCQLGDGFTNSNKLKPIKLNDVIIEKIVCGLSHSLLLSAEGNIYAFGSYDTKPVSDSPIKLNKSLKFCDIATHSSYNFCAALSVDGIYYVWGEYDFQDEKITEPKEVPYNSFNEIFIKFMQMTYKPIEKMFIEFEDSFISNGNYKNTYEELQKLGEGSYGTVFRVKHTGLLDINAIKKIKFKIQNEKEILKELDIFQIVSRIRQKNILRYDDFWIERNTIKKNLTLYIRMELCEKTLDDLIQNIQHLELDESDISLQLKYYVSSAIFLGILKGVNYLHKQNPQIIHRDLCPDNILIKMEKNGEVVVKIADFGLVTIHKYAEQLHEPDVGHIRYIAPEVGDGGDYDTRADIFSVGMIARDLFDIYPDESIFATNNNDSSILVFKCENMEKLFERMISDNVNDRPHCEEILDVKNLWALNLREFVNLDEINELLDEVNNISKFQSQPFLRELINQKVIDDLKNRVNMTKIPFTLIMESLENRKQSFIDKGWDQNIAVSVDDLSEAGFYYKGKYDEVECFHCSVCIRNWVESDDPWMGHAMFQPNCFFLNTNKSKTFINECQKYVEHKLASKCRIDSSDEEIDQ